MGIFDKAKDLAGQHADQVDGLVDKAGDLADERTGGKYAGQVDQGQEFIKGQYREGEVPPAEGLPVEEPPADAPPAP